MAVVPWSFWWYNAHRYGCYFVPGISSVLVTCQNLREVTSFKTVKYSESRVLEHSHAVQVSPLNSISSSSSAQALKLSRSQVPARER